MNEKLFLEIFEAHQNALTLALQFKEHFGENIFTARDVKNRTSQNMDQVRSCLDQLLRCGMLQVEGSVKPFGYKIRLDLDFGKNSVRYSIAQLQKHYQEQLQILQIIQDFTEPIMPAEWEQLTSKLTSSAGVTYQASSHAQYDGTAKDAVEKLKRLNTNSAFLLEELPAAFRGPFDAFMITCFGYQRPDAEENKIFIPFIFFRRWIQYMLACEPGMQFAPHVVEFRQDENAEDPAPEQKTTSEPQLQVEHNMPDQKTSEISEEPKSMKDINYDLQND